MSGLVLNDGAMQVQIKHRDGGITESEIDVVLLQLACEEVEAVHNLPLDNKGCMKPTAQFLKDLSDKLASLGVLGCTPAVAVGLWAAASEKIAELKKNTDQTQSLLSGTESTPSEPSLLGSNEPDCGCA
jgi:hypothetical protein